jgi:hypothetical protein
MITRPEESYRLWCVVVCDQETSWTRSPPLLPTARLALLWSSWRSCFRRAALFIMRAKTSLFIHLHRQKSKRVRCLRAKFKQLYLHTRWKLDTLYYEVFTRYSPCYQLLKYLLFLLKHPVFTCVCRKDPGLIVCSTKRPCYRGTGVQEYRGTGVPVTHKLMFLQLNQVQGTKNKKQERQRSYL